MFHESLALLHRLIIPPFCAYCRVFLSQDTILCDECYQKIRPVVSYELAITATKKVIVHAVGKYDQPLVSLILAKSYGNRTIACQLGKLVWQMSAVSHLSFDCIVPIPLHWMRYAWRGYNQAEEIAHVIARNAEKPVIHLLKRVRRTPYQSFYKGDERYKNVQNIFTINSSEITQYKNKHILLIDDVMTSGATLKEAAKILFTIHPASITALVIARVI
jgi:ComF family protein